MTSAGPAIPSVPAAVPLTPRYGEASLADLSYLGARLAGRAR